MTYPGHRPALLPVAGHGCCFLKLLVAAFERLMCPCLSRTQDVQRRVVYMVLCPCGTKGRLQSIQKSKSAIFFIGSLKYPATRGDAQCFGCDSRVPKSFGGCCCIKSVTSSGRGFAQSAASLILSGERGLQIVRLRSFDSTYCSIQKVQPTLTLGGEKMCLGATTASYSMPMSHRSLRAASEGTSQPQHCNREP